MPGRIGQHYFSTFKCRRQFDLTAATGHQLVGNNQCASSLCYTGGREVAECGQKLIEQLIIMFYDDATQRKRYGSSSPDVLCDCLCSMLLSCYVLNN
jgi:hypothetical protein